MTNFLEKLGTKPWKNFDNNWVWRDVTSDAGDVVMAKRFGLQQKEKLTRSDRVFWDSMLCPSGRLVQ